MANINQILGKYIRLTPEIRRTLKENKSLIAFLEALAKKLDGSDGTLKDLEDTESSKTLSRLSELSEQIEEIKKTLKNRQIPLLEEEIEEIKRTLSNKSALNDVLAEIDSLRVFINKCRAEETTSVDLSARARLGVILDDIEAIQDELAFLDGLDLYVTGTPGMTLEAVITFITDKITAIEEDIVDINTAITTINGTLTTISGIIETIQDDIDTINTTLTSHTSTLSDHETRITALEGA